MDETVFPDGHLTVGVGPTSNFNSIGRRGVVEVGRDGFCPGPEGDNNVWPLDPSQGNGIWGQNRTMWITATGRIGSGVLFTGDTGPRGWDTLTADGEDWVLPGRAIPRYCLLGAFLDMEVDLASTRIADLGWFVIGDARGTERNPITWSLDIRPDPEGLRDRSPGPRPQRLLLACNRPPGDGPNPGERFWTVEIHLRQLTPEDLPEDCSSPPPRSPMCRNQVDGIHDARKEVLASCTRRGEAEDASEGSLKTLQALVTTWIAYSAGLSVAAATPHLASARTALAQVIRVGGAVAAGAATGAATALTGVGTALLELDRTGAALAGVVTTATAVVSVAAVATAAAGGPWAIVVTLAVTALYAGLAAILLAMLATYIENLRQVLARSVDVHTAQETFQNRVAAANLYCCPADVADDPQLDLTLPTCES